MDISTEYRNNLGEGTIAIRCNIEKIWTVTTANGVKRNQIDAVGRTVMWMEELPQQPTISLQPNPVHAYATLLQDPTSNPLFPSTTLDTLPATASETPRLAPLGSLSNVAKAEEIRPVIRDLDGRLMYGTMPGDIRGIFTGNLR